jgi:hypothetical protein
MICHFSLWHWIGENRDSLLVVFTFLLFVVTLFLAIYTGKLWTSTRDMVVSAGDQMRLAREEFIACIAHDCGYEMSPLIGKLHLVPLDLEYGSLSSIQAKRLHAILSLGSKSFLNTTTNGMRPLTDKLWG